MNHGSVGFVDEFGIQLPEDILHPLSIREGSIAYVLYYPWKSDKHAEHVPKVHDFMITPIPFQYWHCVGRLTIRMHHRPGSIEEITGVIKDQKASILLGECTRTGHRYATYSLTVCLEELYENRDELNDSPQAYAKAAQEKVKQKLDAIVVALKEKDRELDPNVLFHEPKDLELNTPIECAPLSALPYFQHFASQRDETHRRTGDSVEGYMQVTCKGGRLWSKELAKFIQSNTTDELQPISRSYALAELDPCNANIRIALVPEKSASRFALVDLHYSRRGNQTSTLGALHTILKNSHNVNIWRTLNYSVENSGNVEGGRISLLVEDKSRMGQDGNEPATTDRMRAMYHGMEGTVLAGDTEITEARTWGLSALFPPLTPGLPGTPRTGADDVFLSHAKEDKAFAESVLRDLENSGLRVFVAKRDIDPGSNWTSKIRDRLIQARHICVVISKNSIKSDWVTSEWAAAWVLNRPIYAILHKIDRNHKKIDSRIKKYQMIEGDSAGIKGLAYKLSKGLYPRL